MQKKAITKKATDRAATALAVAPEYREGGWDVIGFMILGPPVPQTRTRAISSYIPALIVRRL